MDSNSPENGPKDPGRRKFIKIGAEAAVFAGFASLGITGGSEVAGGPRISDIFAADKEVLDNNNLFNRVAEKVRLIADKNKRELATSQLESFRRINEVNDRFVAAYNADVDENGVPRLLTLYANKYKNLGIDDPESMIFITDLNRRTQDVILNPLRHTLEKDGDVSTILSAIDNYLRDDVGGVGENKYAGHGDWIRLRDYEFVGTKQGGEIKIQPGAGEITWDKGRKNFEEDVDTIKQFTSIYPNIGDTTINLWSDNYGNDTDDKEEGKNLFEGEGVFIEKGNDSEIDIKVKDILSIETLDHEKYGHQADILLNDTQLFKYLTPEKIYQLFVKREEALSHPEWGRNYDTLEKIFSKRPRTVSFVFGSDVRKFPSQPIGSPHQPVLDIKEVREPRDNYPEGVFCTGIYAENSEGWKPRAQDKDVINEYLSMIDKSGGESRNLSEFLNSHEVLIKVIGEKSEWMGKVFEGLRKLAPLLDGRTDWLPRKWVSASTLEDRLKSDNVTNKQNSSWFNFCVTTGQRMAVIEMMRTRDPGLDILSPEDRELFKARVFSMYKNADQEMWANMRAVSIAAKRGNIAMPIPSPYLSYDEVLAA